MSRSAREQDLAKSRGRPESLPKRWSAQRKAEVVLRLLRGEDIGEVSREIRVRARSGRAIQFDVPQRCAPRVPHARRPFAMSEAAWMNDR